MRRERIFTIVILFVFLFLFAAPFGSASYAQKPIVTDEFDRFLVTRTTKIGEVLGNIELVFPNEKKTTWSLVPPIPGGDRRRYLKEGQLDATKIVEIDADTGELSLKAQPPEIPAHYYAEVPVFTKLVDVFGIHLYATPTSPDEKLLHAANVLAEYLDNDEDGVPDDRHVMNALVKKKAIIIMTKDSGDEWEAIHGDLNYAFPDAVYHNQYAVGAIPNAIEQGTSDGCWEEILHLITRHGYGNAYPSVFAPVPGSKVAAAVDLARGGHFKDAPEQYPDGSWYNYYDASCRYGCQIDEYMYWTITSILGAQNLPGRAERINAEWPLYTKEKVRDGDPSVYALLTDPQYSIPTVLPDGIYRAKTFPIEEIQLEVKVQEENYFPPEGRYPATVRFVTESQAPGGEAIKIAFTITDENEHAGKSLCFMTSTVFTLESELFSIITEIKPEMKDVQSVDEIDMTIIEGERVWLTTEPMVGITGSVFPKVVSIERMED